MPENAFELCSELARRHGPKFGMRTLDTLHLACALELKADRLWTFDERQGKLAKMVGIKVAYSRGEAKHNAQKTDAQTKQRRIPRA